MYTYVLLIILSTGQGGITTQTMDFTFKARCEKAKEQVLDVVKKGQGRIAIDAVCIKKI